MPNDPSAVVHVRPSGSADHARDEVLPTVSLPTSVRSLALTILTVIAATWALYAAQSLFVPLLFGVVISLVLSPVVEGLRRVRVPRALGAALVLVVVIGAVGGIGDQLSAPAAEVANELPTVARRLRQTLVRSTAGRDGPMADLQEAAQA